MRVLTNLTTPAISHTLGTFRLLWPIVVVVSLAFGAYWLTLDP